MSRWFVRLCAALIILRACTNFAKLFQGEKATLVFFGQILHGADSFFLAAVVGVFMLVTGLAMLQGGSWALPLTGVYAAYVATNLVAWTLANPGELDRVGRMLGEPSDPGLLRPIGAALFLGYCVVALAITAGPAWILYRQRAGAA